MFLKRINLQTKLNKLKIKDFNFSHSEYKRIHNDSILYNFSLIGYDNQGSILSNHAVDINLNILQSPYYTFFMAPSEFIKFYVPKSKSDENGIVKVQIKISKGYPGFYAISFSSHGINSEVLTFKTNFEVQQLIIQQNPVSYSNREGKYHKTGTFLSTVN